MTAVLPDREAPTPAAPDVRYAGWWARAAALAVDVVPAVAVIAVMALLAVASPLRGWLWWTVTVIAALTFVLAAANRWVLPAQRGWSLGRALVGAQIVTREGAPAGTVRLFLRDLVHLLDTAVLFVGWLWPLWDRRHRTFADMVLRTESHRVSPAGAEDPDDAARRTDVRRRVGAVLLIAALLCVAGGALGYAFVFRPERGIESARNQLADQGPRIVEQMLSYGAATMQDDFAKSQALATSAYRPQLTEQQQAAAKVGATTNEYWATNSAVLSASPDHGVLLVALQGQRGNDPTTVKFISATVQVEFQKTDDRWLVANLTVLKKPNAAAGAGG